MDFFLPRFLYWQLFVTPPLPKEDFAGQTIIVTGGNNGLGLEAARHFTNMNAKKVIIACRSLPKGEAAKKSIEESSGRKGVVDVFHLDLSSYASVKAFAEQCQNLDRIDVLIENAGISVDKFERTENNESTITTNVISTFLLALMMLPKLRETASKYNVKPRLTIVSSEVHYLHTMKKERQQPNMLEYCRDESKAEMGFQRYSLSKLMEVLYCRQLAPKINEGGKPFIILNYLNPGLCWSGLSPPQLAVRIVMTLIARRTDVGGRTLVSAAAAGRESHGQFMTNGAVIE